MLTLATENIHFSTNALNHPGKRGYRECSKGAAGACVQQHGRSATHTHSTHDSIAWNATDTIRDTGFTKIGVGSCFTAANKHPNYKAASGTSDPAACEEACLREFGARCAGFDTRMGCILYQLDSSGGGAITKLNPDGWKLGTCYKRTAGGVCTHESWTNLSRT